MQILITTTTPWEVNERCPHWGTCKKDGTIMIAGGSSNRGYRGQVPFLVCVDHVTEYLDSKLYIQVEEIKNPVFGYIKQP